MQILEHILKIRREKAKQEFSQTVRKQFATIWHCEMWFANFALRISHCENSVATKHYSFVSQKRQNGLRNFALRNDTMVCEISHCEMAPWFAKFRIAKWHPGLRNFALRNGTLVCEISHCEMAPWFAKFRNAKWHPGLRNFAVRISQPCELIAKMPTVLPSDFVLRITFSSELRFRRFWYRWKA